jgi:quercetin 2,3-dioxygenase
MRELIKKHEQVNARMFGGRFHSNKPVVGGRTASGDASSVLFYWSHSVATDDCEFGLHPHEGFEIMTFILEGENAHYDTATRQWTPLRKGDFQVIRSGSGLSHAERIKKGTHAFQIWFDPNLRAAVARPPAYTDYRGEQFTPIDDDGVVTTHYIGGNSVASAATERLSIKKIELTRAGETVITPGAGQRCTLYLLDGRAAVLGMEMAPNDVVNVVGEGVRVEHGAGAVFFVIEVPQAPSYAPVVH